MRKTILCLKINDCFRPIKARAGELLKIKLPCLSCHSAAEREAHGSNAMSHHRSGVRWPDRLLCSRPGTSPRGWLAAREVAQCTSFAQKGTLYWGISWGCHHRLPHTSWLRTTEMCPLAVLEAKNLRSGVGRATLLPKALRGHVLSCISSRPSVAGIASLPSLPLPSRGLSSPCVCVS